MKKMIVFGALGLLLLGGGGAAAFMMMGGSDAKPPTAEEIAAAAAAREPVYLRMEGLTAPIIRTNRIRHYIFLNVTLEMADTSARDEAMKIRPRLHDAFLREFYSKSITDKDGRGTIDFESIKRRLAKQADKVLGENQVLNVLVTRAVRGAG
ncbi:MAG: flagellar basal body-associated FliL family protein [Minwuia sp.]|uniref:flagellar basal body-associated FliL family protein n=1 Tax=Minwuia sp. TaxID=2493630 RepID=UPI003A88DE56